MIDILEETVHDNEAKTLFCKTPRLNKPETFVLTDIRFNPFMVLNFGDINETQIYRMLHRESPHYETEEVKSFEQMNK